MKKYKGKCGYSAEGFEQRVTYIIRIMFKAVKDSNVLHFGKKCLLKVTQTDLQVSQKKMKNLKPRGGFMLLKVDGNFVLYLVLSDCCLYYIKLN